MRRVLVLLGLCAGLCVAGVQPVAAQSLRKIGELDLAVVGLSGAVDPVRPTIPKNIASGVRIALRGGGTTLTPATVASLLGTFTLEGELSGPGFGEPVTVRQTVDATFTSTDLILPLPAMAIAGNHALSNLRLVSNGRSLLDITPRSVTVEVIDQVLVTSVTTRPLTLQEIRDRGIVLDSDDYLGFEFTLGLKLESKAVNISFPVVFDRNNIAVPLQQSAPSLGAGFLNDPVMVPTIIPFMMKLPADFQQLQLPNIKPEEIRIPSVLVIPGDVGYLRQFFSAQLFVGNGTPGRANLTVREVTGTLVMPPGADHVVGTSDDPLSLAETINGIQPLTMAVIGAGPDGAFGTADDLTTLRAGEQGQAEFLVRGDLEGFHPIAFDIEAVLDGLPTGPVEVTGRASGGVLVRNPFFDVSFTVPAIVRRGEPFKLYATVTNKGEGLANAVTMTLDAARMSGAHLLGEPSATIDTLMPGDAKTLVFEFESERTGQVVASYLKFEGPGATGNLQFTLGVGERGIALSPDTLVLPSQVDQLPSGVFEAAMRVLGQAWSIANTPPMLLPAGVTRISKAMVTGKAIALAEAGLRITLGQLTTDAVRDLLPDFYAYGDQAVDRGFDQLLRTTNAGLAFNQAVGVALAPALAAAGTAADLERAFAQVAASGSDFIALSIGNGTAAAGADLALVDNAGRRLAFTGAATDPRPQVVTAAAVPLGTPGASPYFGYVASPAAGPYVLDLTGRTGDATDLSVTYPRGDGLFTRGTLAGAAVPAGGRARLVLDPSRTAPALEIDADADGLVDSSLPLTLETIGPSAPQFVSATVIGPETLPSAGPFGQHLALLFDRAVDPTRAASASHYSMPSNFVRSAKRQLSGRLVFATIDQPEGPYVPTTFTVTGMADLRGQTSGTTTLPLQSRLADFGAVLSGRVISGDGNSVAGVTIIYAALPNVLSCDSLNVMGVSQVQADASGRFEFRYIRHDPCGSGWTIHALDDENGTRRFVSGIVRSAGERIVADIALLGRGIVTGVVRGVNGAPVPGAKVVVVSTVEPQIGASTTTDGEGRYVVTGITVGGVSVKAGEGIAVGSAAGIIPRAGSTAVVDVTLNSGSVRVSGTVQRVENGVTTPAAQVYVLFETGDPLGGSTRLVGVAQTRIDGTYTLTDMPAGPFTIRVTLDTGDSGTISGTASAGDVLTGRDVLVLITRNARVSGVVRYPDGSPVAGPVVTIGQRGVEGAADGTFTVNNVAVQASPQSVVAVTPDGRRKGSATVLVNQSGQEVSGVVVTLSGVGRLDLLVLDGAGAPVPNQQVLITRAGSLFAAPCMAIDAAMTDAAGRVSFTGLETGAVKAEALRSAPGYVDYAAVEASIPRDGAITSSVMRFGGAGVVRGVVRDPSGQPSFGAEIEIHSRVYNAFMCRLEPGLSHRLRTDTSGAFRATGVTVGSVSVRASQPFYPTPIAKNGVIARDGDELVLDVTLVDTIAGTVSGRVFLPDGVTPAGAGVQLSAVGALPEVVVSTNAAGEFAFPEIFPEGYYRVTVTDPRTGGVNQEQLYLQAGQNLAHDFRLKGRGTVRVRVVDGGGNPVPSAFVRLTETKYPNAIFEAALDASNEGVVTFGNVHESSFAVDASDEFARGGRNWGEVPAPGATIDVTVRLTVTGSVQGRFLMPDGTTPIPFAAVSLRANGENIGQTTTSSGEDSGAFRFEYVPAGTVRLEALDPATGRTGVATGQITTDGQLLPLDVRAQALGVVEGFVRKNLDPERGAHVSLRAGQFHAEANADLAGHYRIPGVPEGAVTVTADIAGGFTGVASASFTGEGTVLTLDVSLRSSGSVSGIVTQADGVTPAPPSIVAIQVGGLGGGRQTTTTDAAGAYHFDDVAAGLATITVSVLGSVDTATTVAEVLAGDAIVVPVQLIGVGGISGTARDSSGAPVGGTVTVTGTGPIRYTLTLIASGDGSFSAPQVLAGPFSVSLRSTVGGFTLYGTSTGTVVPSQTATVTVDLQSTGTISGIVLRSDGATAAVGTTVSLRNTSNAILTTVPVVGDGTFSLPGVPLGTFSLTLFDVLSNGYAAVPSVPLTTNGQLVDVGTLVLDDSVVTVSSIVPVNLATDVSPATPVVVTFSDAIQSSGPVSLLNGTTTLGVSKSLSADKRTVTLTGTWPDSTLLTVSVSTSIVDTFGRHLAAPVTSQFRTQDLSGPAVTSVAPLSTAIQVPGTTAIEVTYSEPVVNAALAGLVTLTGPSGGIAGAVTRPSPAVLVFTPDAPLADNGVYTVHAAGAADAVGNVQTGTFTSTFATNDTVAPVLALVAPAAGSWTTSLRPTVRVSALDATSGVDTATRIVIVDGASVATTVSGQEFHFTPAVNLAEGQHTVTASAADRAGNAGALGSTSFGLDATAPSVPVLSITEGQTLAGTVTISATSTDALSGVSYIDVRRAGNFILRLNTPSFTGTWNTNGVTDGPTTLTALATDVAGNTSASSAPVNIVVDNHPLTVTITSPVVNFRTRFPVTATATVSEPVTRVEFTLGAITVTDTASPYQATLDVAALPEGNATITVTAFGTLGEVVPATRIIVVDRSSPVARWTFEEGAGTTTADVSGTGHTGTLVNGAAWATVGRFGRAISFDGSDDAVTVADSDLLDAPTAVTLSAWVSPTATGALQHLISKSGDGGPAPYALRLAADGRAEVVISPGGTPASAQTAAAVPQLAWTHLAATYDGATVRLYVNGAPQASAAATGLLPASPGALWLGSSEAGGTLTGRLDEVRIYDRALTAAEVLALASVAADGGRLGGGSRHTLVGQPGGPIWGFGQQNSSSLGNGTGSGATYSTPSTTVQGLTDAVAVASGEQHGLALTAAGTLYAWGGNSFGALGDGSPTTTTRTAPVPIALDSVVAIAAGQFHSVALKANGEAYAWGRNLNGELGDGTLTNKLVPTLVMTGVRAIGAGVNTTLFVKDDGTVWATGVNPWGQLGDNSTTQRQSPVQMVGVTGAVRAFGNNTNSYVLLADGTVRGAGFGGRVGDGTTTNRLIAVPVSGLTEVVALATGQGHVLARRADGTVWAWGASTNGQLGTGSTAAANAPVQVPGLANVADVGGAWDHSMAVTADGVVYTWGENVFAQLGQGFSGGPELSPRSISDVGYAWLVGMPDFSVAAGTFNANQNVVVTEATPGATIYYTRDGTEPTETSSTVASGATLLVDTTQVLKAKAFKAGMPPSHTRTASYVLKPFLPTITPASGTFSTPQTVSITESTAGAVIRYTLDGSDPVDTSTLYTGSFQVATTTTVKAAGFKTGWTRSDVRSAPITMNFGTAPVATTTPAPGTYVASVTVSLSSPIPGAIIRYTTNNTNVFTSSPVYSSPLPFVATTNLRTRVYHPDYNTSSELVSTYTIQVEPPLLSLPSGAYDPGTSVIVTATDPASTMRFTIDGTDPTSSSPIVTSGTSMSVGNYTLKVAAFKTGFTTSAVTAATYTLTSALSGGNVSFGQSHAVLATPDGRVFTWGDNFSGSTGHGSAKTLPTVLPGLTGVQSGAAGRFFSFAVTFDGRLFAWGENGVGMLGDGSTISRSTPVQITGIPPVAAVAGGNNFSLAATTAGDVYAWGSGSNGQLGNGGTGNSLVPLQVPGLSNVVAVAAGFFHAVALTADGHVYTWGYNANGRLGDGTTTQRNSPTLVTTISNVAAIAAGEDHTLAVLRDGRVYGWGLNSNGQLGLGNTTSPLVPTVVPGLSATQVSGGFFNSIATRVDGAVVVAGSNSWLEIGDGTSTQRTSFTPATGMSGATAVAMQRATIAIMPTGAAYTWGAGDTSQLADGTFSARGTPTLAFTIPGPWAPAAPTFSVAPGSYSGVVTVVVASNVAGAVIRYTLDGSTPTESSPQVDASGEVVLSTTTTLRARAFVSGRVPSVVTGGTYVVTP